MDVTEELLAEYDRLALHDANEAETRIHIVDRILFEVLDWLHDDVKVEERVTEDGKTTFADYIVRTANSAFVIEAKKVGVAFSDVPQVSRHQLSGTLMGGATGEAIRQARDYCRRTSIPFGVVTNGAQWVVFTATRIDSVPFKDSTAIIFPSLRSVLEENFSEFSDTLSREAVTSGSLESLLLGRSGNQTEERRLRHYFHNRGKAPIENPLYPLIADAVISAFSDSIVDATPGLLAKCYVNTPERRKFDRQVKMYLSNRRIPVGVSVRRALTSKSSGALKETLEAAVSAVRPVAILMLGTVGSGKTTFLKHARYVSNADYFSGSKEGPYPHWVDVDFRDFTPGDNVRDFIYRAIRDYVADDWFLTNYEQCIRPAYKQEIEALKNGPLKLISGDRDRVSEKISDFLLEQSTTTRYVDKILRYAASKAPIFLVVDNVDHVEAIADQERIFATSIGIAHKNSLNLVVAMRDSTYVKNKSAPTFDAFDVNPIYIDPPAIPAVLSKRFFLMRSLLSGKRGSFTAETGARIDIGDLSIVADMMSSSVLGSNIGQIIDVLATSDVRLALRMTREFLESGYSNPGRAVTVYRESKRYQLPMHEALRAVMLGKQSVYNEKYSIIGNPFDSHLGRTEAQLLRIYIVSALTVMAGSADFQYLRGEDLRNVLRSVGFGDDAVLQVLADLCGLRFIHTASHDVATYRASFAASRLGGFILRRLMVDLTFIETTMMDTFISEKSVWEKLKGLSERVEGERNVVARIDTRVQRAREFYAYMQRLYEPLFKESKRRGLASEWCHDPFEENRRNLEANLGRVVRSAKRNYASG